MNNTNSLRDIDYRVDKGALNGDEMALTIKRGDRMVTFTGEKAEMIEALISQHTQEAVERASSLEISKGHYENIKKQGALEELEKLFDRADGDRSARKYTSIVEQRMAVLKALTQTKEVSDG